MHCAGGAQFQKGFIVVGYVMAKGWFTLPCRFHHNPLQLTWVIFQVIHPLSGHHDMGNLATVP